MEIEDIGSLFSQEFRKKIQLRLVQADMPITSERYLGAVFLLFFACFGLLFPISPILALLIPTLLFSLSLYLPTYLSFLRSRKAEKELPFFLKSLATLLKSNLDPLTSLELASRTTPTIGRSISRVLQLRKEGVPLSRAIQREAETYVSGRVRRVMDLLGNIVEGGYGVESMEKYADSLIHARRIEIREFSNKLALFTLIFIALTAIAPSILLMYSLLLPTIFGTQVDPVTLNFVLFFLIPVLTLLTLGYVGSRMV